MVLATQTLPVKKDLIVIGAGPAGLSLASCLAHGGFQVAVVDRQEEQDVAEPRMDGRDIALTHFSKSILDRLGVWRLFDPECVYPLKEATVTSGQSPFALHFERQGDSEAPLGYLVANHHIRQALYEKVAISPNIECIFSQEVTAVNTGERGGEVVLDSGTQLRAPLVVSADSRFSATRRMMGIGATMKDFGRVMVVCNMKHDFSHRHTAQESFYYGRTCAVLPLGEGFSSVVITVPAARSNTLCELDQVSFSREVEKMLNHKLGAMELISERFSYPLVGVLADKFIAQRYALIGDAAVGMHPVTAHGYNLGLRSAHTLAVLLLDAHRSGKDPGSRWLLEKYQLRHRLVAVPLYHSTNQIVRLFTNDMPAAKLARSAVLRIADRLPPFKRFVEHQLTHVPY